jgi:uncharacterized protein (DUF2384 family)
MAISFSPPDESRVNRPPKSINSEVWIQAVKPFSTEESALEWLDSKLGIFNDQTALGFCRTEKGKQWVMGCLHKIETGELIS